MHTAAAVGSAGVRAHTLTLSVINRCIIHRTRIVICDGGFACFRGGCVDFRLDGFRVADYITSRIIAGPGTHTYTHARTTAEQKTETREMSVPNYTTRVRRPNFMHGVSVAAKRPAPHARRHALSSIDFLRSSARAGGGGAKTRASTHTHKHPNYPTAATARFFLGIRWPSSTALGTMTPVISAGCSA